MVKHVLFVKLKENTPENCQKLKELFLSMKDEIDFIRDIAVGIDYLHSERSYDVVLELVVDSPEALEAYQVHPYHANVVKPYVLSVKDGSNHAVDYEF
jgi:hypothetical protein